MDNNTFFMSLNCPENMGDLVLKRELSRLLSRFGETVLYLPGTVELPQSFGRGSHLGNSRVEIGRKLFKAAFRRGKVWLVLSPGGGGSKGGSVGGIIGKLFIYSCLKIIGVRILQLGLSTECELPGHAWRFRIQSKMRYHTGYRDSLSLSKAMARNQSNVGFFPDLSFLYGSKLGEQRTNFNSRPRYVLISVRKSYFVRSAHYDHEILEKIRELNEISRPNSIALFYQVSGDAKTQQYLSGETGIKLLDCPNFPWELKVLEAVYVESKFVVSNRLHVLLFGMFLGCIPIPLISNAENGKVRGMFVDAGLQELCLDIFAPQSLTMHLENIDAKSLTFRAKIEEWIQSSERTILKTMQELIATS